MKAFFQEGESLKKQIMFIFAIVLSFGGASFNQVAEARRQGQGQDQRQDQSRQGISQVIDEHSSDSDIIRAVNDQRRVDFVEGGSLVVSKVLPDDRSGLKHQKWVVRLSNGKEMEAVYNLDMCPRVPINVGDKIAMGGQFVWTNKGALLHWLHHDPRGNRPDGFVYAKGQFHCKE